MGGGEYQAKTLAIRLGGGRDGLHQNDYLSGGFPLFQASAHSTHRCVKTSQAAEKAPSWA